MSEEQKIVSFLNYLFHYKSNYPNARWEVFLKSPYKNAKKSNEDYFEELQFTQQSVVYIIPKLIRFFNYPDVDDFLLRFLKWDYFFTKDEEIYIKSRVKQSKNDKILHDIERVIRLLIALEE